MAKNLFQEFLLRNDIHPIEYAKTVGTSDSLIYSRNNGHREIKNEVKVLLELLEGFATREQLQSVFKNKVSIQSIDQSIQLINDFN